MKSLVIAILLAVSLPAMAETPVEKCVTKKVNTMRASKDGVRYERENGYEIPATQDMLDEFETMCKYEQGKKKQIKK